MISRELERSTEPVVNKSQQSWFTFPKLISNRRWFSHAKTEETLVLNSKDFKIRGELERTYDLAPLPPTKISEQAKEELADWGLTSEQIEALQEFTSSFRYDLVPEKVERLQQESIKVFKKDGQEYINLPSFFDTGGRFDGQCMDIANQWVVQIHESKLIKELNRNLKKGNKVVPTLHSGLSETHFCKDGSSHCWNGLALVDKDGNVKKEIYVDAAFQNIQTKDESKYIGKTAYINPKGIWIKKQYNVPIGWIDVDGHSFEEDLSGTAILGVSFSYEDVYELGFSRDRKTNNIRLVLSRLYADGSRDYYIIGDEDQIIKTNGLNSTRDMEEIKKILIKAKGLRFVKGESPEEENFIWERSKKRKRQEGR